MFTKYRARVVYIKDKLSCRAAIAAWGCGEQRSRAMILAMLTEEDIFEPD